VADIKAEPESEQVRALLDSDKAISKEIVDNQRPKIMHRARVSGGFRDTILFAFVTIWAFFRE